MASIKPSDFSTVAAAGRRMYEGGLATGATGAIGVRLNGDAVAVTAAGTRLGFIGESDLIVMNGAGPDLENGKAASRETGMIRAVLSARSEAGAVIRVHGPYTTALSHKGRKVLARHASMLDELGGVVFVPYYRPGTAGLAGAVAEVLRSNRVAIIEGQGAVVWGADADGAIDGAEALEAAARVMFILDGSNGC